MPWGNSADSSKRHAARRVLFIDDDETILDVWRRYFAKVGYQVFTAPSGHEGIKTFNRILPDVAVVDLHLPDISGLSVLERIRSKRHMVIMLTGDGEVANAVEAMRRGAENFLIKPIDMPHLEVAVEKAAEKAALYREVRKLRSEVPMNFKRKMLQMSLASALIVLAAGMGLLIGGRDAGPRPAPIPVPFNPRDTAINIEVGPFRPIPAPRISERWQPR